MLSVFLFGSAVFDACQRALQSRTPSNFFRPAFIGLAAVVLAIATWRSWARTFGLSATDETQAPNKRRIVTVTLIIGGLLLCTSVLFGWLIGKNRKQLRALDGDLAQYSALGDRISKSRNEVKATIPDYIQMYESIESDVITLQICSSRLIAELKTYDVDFPEYRDQTNKSIANVSKTERRTALLIKQIAVAKRIKTMESQEQKAAWVGELVPLAQEEDKLDNDTAH